MEKPVGPIDWEKKTADPRTGQRIRRFLDEHPQTDPTDLLDLLEDTRPPVRGKAPFGAEQVNEVLRALKTDDLKTIRLALALRPDNTTIRRALSIAREQKRLSASSGDPDSVHAENARAFYGENSVRQALGRATGAKIPNAAMLLAAGIRGALFDELLALPLDHRHLDWAVKLAKKRGALTVPSVAALGIAKSHHSNGAIQAARHVGESDVTFYHAANVAKRQPGFLLQLRRRADLDAADRKNAILAASWHGTDRVNRLIERGVRGTQLRKLAEAEDPHGASFPIQEEHWRQLKAVSPGLAKQIAQTMPEAVRRRLGIRIIPRRGA